MAGNDQQARIYAFLGSSGCGKTTAMLKMLARPKRHRTLVWSPKEVIDNYAGRWPGSVVVRSAMEVLNALKAAGKGELHLVFVPPIERKARERLFDATCQIALKARNLSFIAEELHTVTRASWAPDGWTELVSMGRGYGIEVMGCSQRPASMDKDFLGNCSLVRVGRLSYPEDCKTVSKSLGVPVAQVAGLVGYKYIQRDMGTGAITTG